ncbi:MAG: tetratricopeptide repeat protein [Pyrinomonadaceae bacterium]
MKLIKTIRIPIASNHRALEGHNHLRKKVGHFLKDYSRRSRLNFLHSYWAVAAGLEAFSYLQNNFNAKPAACTKNFGRSRTRNQIMPYKQTLFIFLILLPLASIVTAQSEVQQLIDKAAEHEKRANYVEAIGAYLEVLKTSPGSATVYNNLGADYFELGRYSDAILALRKSVSLNPQFEKAFFNLASVYFQLDRFDEAISALKSSVGINPKYILAQKKLCDVYLASDKANEAIDCYEKLLPSSPTASRTHSNYGTALMRAKRYQEAVNVFEESIKYSPPSAETFNNLGVSLFEIRHYREAIAHLVKAVELEPNNQAMRFNLAIAQLADSKKSEALEQYSFLKRTNAKLAEQLLKRIYGNMIIVVKEK